MQKFKQKRENNLEVEFKIQIRLARNTLQGIKRRLEGHNAEKKRQIVRLLKESNIEGAKQIALLVAKDTEAANLWTRLQTILDTINNKVSMIVAEKRFTKLDPEVQRALVVICVNAKEQGILQESHGKLKKVIEDRYTEVKRATQRSDVRDSILSEYRPATPTEEDIYNLFDLVWDDSAGIKKTWDRPTREDLAVEELNPDQFIAPTVVQFEVPKLEQNTKPLPEPHPEPAPQEPSKSSDPSKVWYIRSEVGHGDGPTYREQTQPPTSIFHTHGNGNLSGPNVGAPVGAAQFGDVMGPGATVPAGPSQDMGAPRPDPSQPIYNFDAHVEATVSSLPPNLQRSCSELLDAIRYGDYMRLQMYLANVLKGEIPRGTAMARVAAPEMAMLAALAEGNNYMHISQEITQYLPPGYPPYMFEVQPWPGESHWDQQQHLGTNEAHNGHHGTAAYSPTIAHNGQSGARAPSPMNMSTLPDLVSLEEELAGALDRGDLLYVSATMELEENARVLATHREFLMWVEERVEAMDPTEDTDYVLSLVRSQLAMSPMTSLPVTPPPGRFLGLASDPPDITIQPPSGSLPASTAQSKAPRPRVSSRTSPPQEQFSPNQLMDQLTGLNINGRVPTPEPTSPVSPSVIQRPGSSARAAFPNPPRTAAEVKALFPEPPTSIPGTRARGTSPVNPDRGRSSGPSTAPSSGGASPALAKKSVASSGALSLGSSGADLDELRRMLASMKQ
ncbi:hypothetical protein M427DRAFT_131832 [Gonapodya prolifera JEL478]|uniref:Uncharacterized protein n=1 Tax=Gonapodya prolifera (strain JEL478) TaxID=1344416 RepID=A0A139ATR6_GONPJ|nr:hypothetical protein M427DRAFT_131832 [Gonapodya prolifera JEL478]|eukprot:KXS19885.1 hypothetical protein M427DRAFT_131832 [Gonapodya prolifera JEL478]